MRINCSSNGLTGINTFHALQMNITTARGLLNVLDQQFTLWYTYTLLPTS